MLNKNKFMENLAVVNHPDYYDQMKFDPEYTKIPWQLLFCNDVTTKYQYAKFIQKYVRDTGKYILVEKGYHHKDDKECAYFYPRVPWTPVRDA